MNLPSIITVPDPLLRQVLDPVDAFTPDLTQLAETMITVMKAAEGVGLAANQVGVNKRLFVYEVPEAFEVNGKKYLPVLPQAVINPSIRVIDEALEIMEEGCLSIPKLWGPVARPVGIELQGQSLDGQPFTKLLYGYEARIVQHETDHLNGKLFLDYITDPSKLRRTKD